jgi:hypothetical protein
VLVWSSDKRVAAPRRINIHRRIEIYPKNNRLVHLPIHTARLASLRLGNERFRGLALNPHVCRGVASVSFWSISC